MNSPSLTFEEAVRSAGLNFTTLAQMMGRSEPIEGTQGHYIINKVVKTILSFLSNGVSVLSRLARKDWREGKLPGNWKFLTLQTAELGCVLGVIPGWIGKIRWRK